MKQKLLLKSMLLLFALIAGSSSVWAQAPVNTVLWSEDFSGFDNNVDPSGDYTNSHTGTTVYGGVTITYSKEDGGGTTQTYTSGGPNSNNNLLIAKTNGTFSISGISTGQATELTVSYAKSGDGTIAISSSTTGVTISGSESGSTITTNGATTLQLTFKNTGSKNLRIDDISVKVKTAGTGGGVAAPTFSVPEGAVTAGTTVSLSQADSKTIRYTTDGVDPTKTTGTVYSSPIAITTPVTIKAIAVDGDYVSAVSAASYTISVAKPTFNVAAGNVVKGTELTISAAAGHTIIYTTDGTDPSYENSIGDIYDSPIAINSAMTVKAIAVDDYENESEITSASYTVSDPGAVEITPNYTFFGKTKSFSGTDYAEVTGTTIEGVTITYSKGTGSNTYANASAMRFYPGNTLKIDAPLSKTITKIIFTLSYGTDNMTSTPDTYATDTHTWTGDASSVTFTRAGSSYLQFTKITVVLAAKVTISEYKWATYVSDQVLDFTGSAVKAYVVTGASGTAITKTPVTKAAANTPLLLNAPAETYTIPVAASGTDYSSSNKLVAGTGAEVAYDDNSGYNYVLSVDGENAMFMLIVDGTPATVPTGKAYLALHGDPGARGLYLFDDEETTGVNEVKTQKADGQYFNLAGQRVAQPTKGLYIVNGKKVIIK